MNSLWETARKSPFASPFITTAQCEAKTGNDEKQLVANREIAAAATAGKLTYF
jgi:hypothetical protein